jgi:hypothetical protein
MGKRIVINLDGPGGESARVAGGKRRRWPRILAILAGLILVILVVAAAGGYFWWRHYQSTPVYTLTLMIDAAQRNDLAELQKRIDDDEIAKNMAASVSQKAAGRFGFGFNSSVQEQVDNVDKVMPSLLPRLKQTIHDEVVKQIKELASKSEPRPFILLLVTVPSLVKVTTEGDTAKAIATMSDRAIELTMRRDAERWKVIDFKDDALVQRVVDSVVKELPAIGSNDANNPLLKKPARGKRRR